jgi:hypothetical protein
MRSSRWRHHAQAGRDDVVNGAVHEGIALSETERTFCRKRVGLKREVNNVALR